MTYSSWPEWSERVGVALVVFLTALGVPATAALAQSPRTPAAAWQKLAPDLPQAGLLERSAAQPERLFALIATPAGVLHRSDDLGATWTSAD
ncbi:MAG: hypothetical protein AAF690_25610, partial [Acidobacteriota bacterium]